MINNKHSNKDLQTDYNNGNELLFKKIKTYKIKSLNRMEKFWIKKLNTFNGFGYNESKGGDSYGIGVNNHRYDKTIYTFYHENGKIEKCTQYNLRKKYKLRASDLSSLIHNRLKSTKNWSITKGYWESSNLLSAKKNTVCTFYHYDGKIENLTYSKMNEKYTLGKGDLADIIHKRTKSSSGWSLYKNYFSNIKYDKTIHTFYHYNGQIEKLTYLEMNKKYNLRNGGLSNVIQNKMLSVNGWGIKKDWFKKNPMYDKTTYTFYHYSGKTENLTYLEMNQKYNFNNGDLAKLISGKLKSTKKWCIKI